jgi:hypothetical protein
MPDDDKLSPADPQDLADAIAFALNFNGRKRVHDADAFMVRITVDRIVRHLEQARYVVIKKPPIEGGGDNPGQTGTPARGVPILGQWPNAGGWKLISLM